MFLDDQEGGSDARIEVEELPTGVVTYLTKCYTPCCVDGRPCYAYSCPRRVRTFQTRTIPQFTQSDPFALSGTVFVDACHRGTGSESGACPVFSLPALVEQRILFTPPEHRMAGSDSPRDPCLASRKRSQTPNVRHLVWARSVAELLTSRIISKVISKEQQYIKDLDFIEDVRYEPCDTPSDYRMRRSHVSIRFSFVLYGTQILPSLKAACTNSSKGYLATSLTCGNAIETFSRQCTSGNESRARSFRGSGISSSTRRVSSDWRTPRIWCSCLGQRRS